MDDLGRQAGEPANGLLTLGEARLREVLGRFASGVTVVTSWHEGRPVGFTCRAFVELSLDPPLVAFAPALGSSTWPAIEAAGFFCVNFLADGQEALARVFATKGDAKFEGVGWSAGERGAPVIDGALAWLECSVEHSHECGDHMLVVGRVSAVGDRELQPLLYYRGGYGRFEP